MTQLNSQIASEQADLGIELSAQNSGKKWQTYAIGFLKKYLEENPTMFCDDLWSAGLEKPISSRALGAVMRHAIKEGWMTDMKTDDGIISKQSIRSNNQLKRIWISKLFGADKEPPKPISPNNIDTEPPEVTVPINETKLDIVRMCLITILLFSLVSMVYPVIGCIVNVILIIIALIESK